MSTTTSTSTTDDRLRPGAVAAPPDRSAADRDPGSASLLGSLIGAVAVLASCLSIPPLVEGDSWVWPVVEVVAVVWLVGVGCRLTRLPLWATVPVQLAALAITLTALFTTGGYGGVIPNARVVAEAGGLLDVAFGQIRTSVSTAVSSTALAFLIAGAVGLVAVVVDALIAARAPAMTALPLLCMFSVPAAVDAELLPWSAFVAPAVLYAVLLAVSGIGDRRRGAGAAGSVVAGGIALAAVAVVAALVASTSLTTVGTAGRLPRTGNSASTGIGLSPFTSLQGDLQQTDPVPVLQVTGLSGPDYLRTVGLQRWNPDQGFSVDDLADGQLPGTPAAGATTVTVTSLSYRSEFLPILDGTDTVSGVDGDWSYDAALETVHRASPTNPGTYQLQVAKAPASAEELRADSVVTGGLLTETGDLRPEVTAEAVRVTADATTAFDKADALRQLFTTPTNGFTYSLNVPPGNSGDALLDFLTNKTGYCEQYASAMAIMLRSIGIPARVAIGFTQGRQQPDGSWLISSNDAHAWVEVPFTKAGWVRFDPTPLGNGQGGQQGFTEGAGPTEPTAPTTATAPSAGVDPTTPTAADEPGAGVTPTLPGDAPQASGTQAPAGSSISPTVLAVIAALVVLGALLAAPTVLRERRRRRRGETVTAGGPGAHLAAWAELEDLMVDHDLEANPSESARVRANRLARVAHLRDADRAVLRDIVNGAERAWYAGGPSGAGTGGPDAGPFDRGVGPGDATTTGDGSTNGSARTSGSTTVLARDGDAGDGTALWAGVQSIGAALEAAAPRSAVDRLLPRSVRPTSWRG